MIGTISLVNREVAKVLNYNEDVIKQVNKFFWRYGVREPIRSGNYTSLFIRNLGTLTISRNKINKKIRGLIIKIRECRDPDKVFTQVIREEALEKLYDHLNILLQRRNDIAKIYIQNQEKRDAKILKTSLGKQVTDNAGSYFETILLD